jgi:acetoin utilization protein AcuB
MLVSEWMSKEPITVTPETSLMQATKMMKENKIRRLPVVDENGKLVGIVTDRDIKAASPSQATTLEVHELYYLLSELKIKSIMTKNPVSILADDTVERAALLLTERRIGGLPVVDMTNKVVGVISDMDVFRVLIAITGVKHGGVQLAFQLSDEPGSLKQMIDDLRRYEARIVSILTSFEEGGRKVYVRIKPMDRAKEDTLVADLKMKYKLTFWARDSVHPVEG